MLNKLYNMITTSATFTTQAPNISQKDIIDLRNKYLTSSLKTFEASDEPFVLDRVYMQYLYDLNGKKYIDLVGQNLYMCRIFAFKSC